MRVPKPSSTGRGVHQALVEGTPEGGMLVTFRASRKSGAACPLRAEKA